MFQFLNKAIYKFRAKIGLKMFLAGSSNRLNADWITSVIDSNDEIKQYLPKLRERSRDLSKNNSNYRRWIQMGNINVIGPQGFKFQNKASDIVTGKPDKIANDIIERGWKDWCNGRNWKTGYSYCSIDGKDVFRDFLRQVYRARRVDGEYFLRIIRGADNPYLITLQLIDANDIDIEYNVDPKCGECRRIVMGIELDDNDKPVTYYVKQQDTSKTYHLRKYIAIDAKDIIHGFDREFIGQVRGFPTACAAILDLNMSQGLIEAQLVAARASACQMGVLERTGNALGAGKLRGDIAGTDNEKPKLEMEPGKIPYLPSGWTLKTFFPQALQDGAVFLKSIMRKIANGLSVAYNTFANDLEGVNFSSMRSGIQEERDGWKDEQQKLIDELLIRVHAIWLESFLLSGLTDLPLRKFTKFFAPFFQGRRWSWIDPLKDANANETALQTFTKSPQEIIIENGGDPDEVKENILAWESWLNSSGLTLYPNKKVQVNNVTAATAKN